jgi:ribonuclease MRP protein subunit RMP1
VGRVVRLSMRIGGMAGAGNGKAGLGEGSEAVRNRLQREAEVEVQKRAVEKFIRDVLLERCYGAFSSVVRDVQFAALGVVLMGVLARVGREVGLPVPVVQEVEVVSGVSLRQTGVDRGVVVRREWRGGGVETETAVVAGDGDHGEGREESESVKGSGIEQEEVGAYEEIKEGSREIRRADSVTASSSRTGKGKRNRGKKSAIDDLFAGLV